MSAPLSMRQRILNHVQANPGLTSVDMRDTFNLTAGRVGMHLAALRTLGKVHRTEPAYLARWYFGPAPDYIPEPGEGDDYEDELNGEPRRVFSSDWVAPEVKPQGIFAALGL